MVRGQPVLVQQLQHIVNDVFSVSVKKYGSGHGARIAVVRCKSLGRTITGAKAASTGAAITESRFVDL